MSEVTRYRAPALIDGRNVMKSAEGFSVVSAAHYDAAQSELAALREELADSRFMLDNNSKVIDRVLKEKAEFRKTAATILKRRIVERDSLQQRLADAERRNAELQVYDNFVGYLLDYCEGETIYEESLQRWLAESIERNDLTKPEEAKS
jgi:hypothetical protein